MKLKPWMAVDEDLQDKRVISTLKATWYLKKQWQSIAIDTVVIDWETDTFLWLSIGKYQSIAIDWFQFINWLSDRHFSSIA